MDDGSDALRTGEIAVLIVVNDALTCLGLSVALSTADDIKVAGKAQTAADVRHALEANRIDILLIDLTCSTSDTKEVMEYTRRHCNNLGRVLLSSSQSDREIAAAFDGTPTAYCTNGVDRESLCMAIRTVNLGHSWVQKDLAAKVFQAMGKAAPTLTLLEKPTSIANVHSLTTREMAVLRLVMKGLTNQQIADKLSLSLATTKVHVRSILNKLSVDDRTQAAVEALKRGMVSL